MIIRNIKTGREIEVMEGTVVPEGFAIKVTNHTYETDVSEIIGEEPKKVEKLTKKARKVIGNSAGADGCLEDIVCG